MSHRGAIAGYSSGIVSDRNALGARRAFLAILGVLAVLATAPVLAKDAAAAENKRVDLQGRWRTVRMRVTAYCPCAKCCSQYADGITANGHRIVQGDRFVAADRQYAFGTHLIVPGYNGSRPVRVLDRGGAIKGNRLDVFFNTHQEALEWGVQYLDVLIRAE